MPIVISFALVVDRRNDKMYLSVGSPCDLCRMDEGFQTVGNTNNPVPYHPEIAGYEKVLPITRQDSLLAATQKRPVALVPAHYAPMGLHFYTGEQVQVRKLLLLR